MLIPRPFQDQMGVWHGGENSTCDNHRWKNPLLVGMTQGLQPRSHAPI